MCVCVYIYTYIDVDGCRYVYTYIYILDCRHSCATGRIIKMRIQSFVLQEREDVAERRGDHRTALEVQVIYIYGCVFRFICRCIDEDRSRYVDICRCIQI